MKVLVTYTSFFVYNLLSMSSQELYRQVLTNCWIFWFVTYHQEVICYSIYKFQSDYELCK